MPQQRDVLVVGGSLAGTAAALAATRNGARTRLLLQDANPPGETEPIPDDVRERAIEAADERPAPAPEEPQVFRFRARRVRRWLDELGIENDASWARNLHEAMLDRAEREGAALDDEAAAVRLIGDAETGVSGAVLVDGEDTGTHRSDTTILAGGGVGYLWPDTASVASPPTGLALALRAELPTGDLGQLAWDEGVEGPQPGRLLDGVRGDGRGRGEVPGVAACGEVLACPWHADPALRHVEDVARGLEAGGFQAPPADETEPELVPIVDDPMPPGFCKVKLGRLRGTLEEGAGPDADADTLEDTHAKLLALRGEFKDYARARAETDVQVLHQCADVALAHVDARLDGDPGEA
jgi:hypothetical protein